MYSLQLTELVILTSKTDLSIGTIASHPCHFDHNYFTILPILQEELPIT